MLSLNEEDLAALCDDLAQAVEKKADRMSGRRIIGNFDPHASELRISARDFAVQLQTNLEPFVRTGRGPEVARQIFELGGRMADQVPCHVTLPKEYSPEVREIDIEVANHRDDFEGEIARHLAREFFRFRSGSFFDLFGLDLEIYDSGTRSVMGPPWLSRGDSNIVAKISTHLTIRVNSKVRDYLRNLLWGGEDPLTTWSVSPYRGGRPQQLSLYTWFIMGVTARTVRQFVLAIGWHDAVFRESVALQTDIQRDLDRSILAFADEPPRSVEILVKCFYVAERLR